MKYFIIHICIHAYICTLFDWANHLSQLCQLINRQLAEIHQSFRTCFWRKRYYHQLLKQNKAPKVQRKLFFVEIAKMEFLAKFLHIHTYLLLKYFFHVSFSSEYNKHFLFILCTQREFTSHLLFLYLFRTIFYGSIKTYHIVFGLGRSQVIYRNERYTEKCTILFYFYNKGRFFSENICYTNVHMYIVYKIV